MVDLQHKLPHWTKLVIENTPYNDSLLSEARPPLEPTIIPQGSGDEDRDQARCLHHQRESVSHSGGGVSRSFRCVALSAARPISIRSFYSQIWGLLM